MFYFVIGLPGHFAQWCAGSVLSRVSGNGAQANVVAVNTPEEITRAMLNAGDRSTVLLASSPGGRVRRALANGARPFLVAIDDPRRVLADLVIDMHMDFAAAVRSTASACPSVFSYSRIGNAIRVYVDDPMSDTEAKIASYLGKSSGDLVGASSSDAPLQRSQTEVQWWWNSLSLDDRSLAEGAISAYLIERDTPSNSLHWGPGLFLDNEQNLPGLGPVDVTGRKRTLFEGPDILITEGAWRITVTMEFSRVAGDYDYRLEVLAGETLAARDFRPGGAGEQLCVLDFRVEETIDYPLSIRVSLLRSAFDGVVTLKGILLEPLPG
jgi:hypothetical protein